MLNRLMYSVSKFSTFLIGSILTIFCCKVLFAQAGSPYIAAIKNYTKYLDSIDNLDNPQKLGFTTGISDGIIKRDNVAIGGFGIYTLCNLKLDTAFRIQYHNNLDINIYKTYYYKSDKLVFAILELQSTETPARIIYHKEECYDKGKVIWTNTQRKYNAGGYIDKIDLDLFEDGLQYLNDFKKGR